MRRVSRFSLDQVLLEHGFCILGIASLNQKTSEVHASYQLSIPCMTASPLKTAMDAEFIELRGDITSAHRSSVANGYKTLSQLRVVRGYSEADNMQGLISPVDGNFHPVDKGNVLFGSDPASFIQSTYVVMVGQRQHRNPTRGRMFHQLRWCQQSVGNGGMTMKINVGHEGSYSR